MANHRYNELWKSFVVMAFSVFALVNLWVVTSGIGKYETAEPLTFGLNVVQIMTLFFLQILLIAALKKITEKILKRSLS